MVNVGKLDIFAADSVVTPEVLLRVGLISSLKCPVKILGDGEIHHPLLVKANKFSAAAKKKIAAAGGKIEGL